MKSINIIRQNNRGDVFLTEPILRQLSEKYHVNLTTKRPQLFTNEYPFSVNKEANYDITINLDWAYESMPKQHILAAYISTINKTLKYDIAFEKPKILLTKKESDMAEMLKQSRYILINIDMPQEYVDSRKVFGLNVQKLGEEIEARYQCAVYEIGMYSDHNLKKITLKNEREAIPLIQSAEVFIGLDSLFLHFAHALNTKFIGFFGGVNPSYRLFSSYNGIVIQGECEQQHCYHSLTNSITGSQCRLNLKPPKCAVTSNENVMSALDQIMDIKFI